jgi:hypothetical protein
MAKLNIDDFKPLEIPDKYIINEHYQNNPPFHSDYSFTTMISWQKYMKYSFTLYEDNLVILTNSQDKTQVRLPVNGSRPEIDRVIMDLAFRECDEPPVGMIQHDSRIRLQKLFPNLNFELDRDFFDYVYLAEDLASLGGKKYMKVRNMINRFRKRYKYTVEPISEENMNEVLDFFQRWCLWKDCDKIPLLSFEKKALLYCMEHFFDLGIFGITIRIDDNIEAASIMESWYNDTAIIHFEKAIPDYDGLYQIINQEAAMILKKDHKFINREADMGFPGLRLAKEKYHPDHMVEVSHINKDEIMKILQ